MMSAALKLIPFALVLSAAVASGAQSDEPPQSSQSAPQAAPPSQTAPQSPPSPGPAIGLADSAGLRATVFGTPPQDMASLPAKVPLSEIRAELPWRLPVP